MCGEPVTFFADWGISGLDVRTPVSYNVHIKARFTDQMLMVEYPYSVKRAHPRFSCFAEAEVTLRDGNKVPAQLAELSSRGCYIDTLEPIPIHSRLGLRIPDVMGTCELQGRVIYLHSGPGLGIFGMGVLFEEMDAEQHSSMNAWLQRLARHREGWGKNSSAQLG